VCASLNNLGEGIDYSETTIYTTLFKLFALFIFFCNATFNNISVISWWRIREYPEIPTDLPQVTDFLECEGEKTIACDNCDKWFHQKCESLSNIHFFFLGKSSFSYFCSDCCLDINTNFRFFGWLTKITTQRKLIHN
jgi:hypothetical protein